VHGATNCKDDSPTFAASRAMPVILAQIAKRLTADGTDFCGGILVCQCRLNSGSRALGVQPENHTFWWDRR
jgi:hypothetical protein